MTTRLSWCAALALLELGSGCASRAPRSMGATQPVIVTTAEPSETTDGSDPPPRSDQTPRSQGLRSRSCNADPSPGDETNARDAFREGVVAYELGRYDVAIEAFVRAYELVCASALLYNLGQALHQVGDPAEAAEAFELYLEREPNGTFAEDARKRLEEIRGGR